MATATEPIVRDRLYIGGEWVEPAGEGTIDVLNPATEAVHRHASPRGPPRTPTARCAPRARPSTTGRASRRTSARRYSAAIGAKLAERGDELAVLITTELGMPFTLSRMIQVGLPVGRRSPRSRSSSRRSTGRRRSATR